MISSSIRRPARGWPALAAFLLFGLALLSAVPAQAHEYKLGALTIGHPWARPSAAKTGAAYLTIRNDGPAEDALLSVEADVAGKVEVHEMKMDGAVMRMRAVGRLAIPAGETVALAPGGLHIMLIGLKGPLTDGEKFPMRLVFEKAGTIEVSVYVQTPEEMRKGQAMPEGGADHTGQMPGMDMH